MSHPLISRSPDLKRLRDEGFTVDVKADHLLVGRIPYVNSRKEIARGTLVSELTLAGDITAAPGTHVVMFIGDQPCHKDGAEIAQIKHGTGNQNLGGGVVVSRSFSNKPAAGYANYYDKMTRYIEIISHPASSLDSSVKANDFFPVPACQEEGSVFKYVDTASSRAGITAQTEKLAIDKVAIVGVGGTGSYILDLLAKTPIKEIHLFDGDRLLNHNAFRAPGAPSLEQLEKLPLKVTYFRDIYANMRIGIVAHEYFITTANIGELRAMNSAFLCMDGGTDKREIVAALQEWKIPFLDVGMGVVLDDAGLGGILRVTTVTTNKKDHALQRIPLPAQSEPDDYATNIQIADLNALNATLAVIKWKKLLGFYRDCEKEHHSTYTIDVNMLESQDQA